MKEKRLGRGLSSLIPQKKSFDEKAQSAVSTNASTVSKNSVTEEKNFETSALVRDVLIQDIQVNPRQPRKYFRDEALEDLVASIKEHGVIQPLVARRVGIHYELIAGERRLRACKKLGLTNVPVIVRSSTDQEQLEIALIENLQREDLDPIEEALAYQRLQKEFSLSHEELAQKAGKNRSTVTNMLRLLKLPNSVQKLVSEKQLSMGHARALLASSDPNKQTRLAQRSIAEDLSVRQIENLVKNEIANPNRKSKKTQSTSDLDVFLRNFQENLQRQLGTKVQIKPKTHEKGEITISYFSRSELQGFFDKLRN
ncbi:MAG: ParB/RepB/Spo0J family partition protein [Bdellovibrionales bacterium]|nr:ParB/RepB/Spo0J family partition protein [Bdellovibrionales bacterium]